MTVENNSESCFGLTILRLSIAKATYNNVIHLEYTQTIAVGEKNLSLCNFVDCAAFAEVCAL